MGANSVLGLLFKISADPSHAQEALAQFEKSTGVSLQNAGKHTKDFDEGILNAHNSVHLLTEEMGIHLPRAVVGAVAEMLPSIGELGGALLGAFAIEKVAEWGKEAFDVVKDLQGGVSAAVTDIGKAAEEAAKHAHDQMATIFSDFKTTAEGVLPMEEVDAQTAKLTKYYGAFLDLQKAENAMQRPSAETMKVVSQAVAEGLTNISDVQSKLNAMAALQSEQHKRYAELVKSESKAACDAVKRNLDKLHKENEKAEQDANALREILIHDLDLQAEGFMNLQVAIDKASAAKFEFYHADFNPFKPDPRDAQIEKEMADQLNAQLQAMMKVGEMALPLTRGNQEVAESTVHLNAVRRMSIEISQEMTEAAKHEVEEVSKHLLASSQQLAGSVAGLIAGRRAQAAVEVPFEIAEGIKCLALGAWPPNPAAYVAAGLHFEAAAAYAKIAGTSAHHHGGAGGSGGSGGHGYSSGRAYRDMEGPGQPPPQTLAAGAASGRYSSPGSGVIVVHGSTDLHQWVAELVNGAVDRGIGVTATYSQRGTPVGH